MRNGKINIQYKIIESPLYYNPVDTDWKREKCNSLGFTYKEPNTKLKFTSYMIPVEHYYDKVAISIIFSELICGDRKKSKQFGRNIVKNLISNEHIEKLFETKEMFEEYIAISTMFTVATQPIYSDPYEDCPICYESKSIPCILDSCKHQLCDNCVDKLVISGKFICPICRAEYNTFFENGEDVRSFWGPLEILATSYYLNVCIYVYYDKLSVWILYHNSLNTADVKNEKCIYLYKKKNHMNVVTNLTPP
ncbi:uncharacterized protein LOC126896879 isoform X2 [Daktulosphaira vitifoliae]|nr:uncharacterized protein LOC126896879 isoform X2 [Daktulosphaira vitifoliae]